VTIFCPARALQVNVTDAHNNFIENVTVNAQELMGGLSYSENTDVNGIAVLNCTFGKYFVKVYASQILLNETTIDLFQSQNISIICKIYGLTVSVKVVDYLGQPIPQANVTLHREGLASRSTLTQSDGTVTFDNIIGGNLQIALYLPGQTQPCATNSFSVEDSTTIQIKIEKYVMLAGFLVETSQLATAIVILVSLVLILSIEIYRRRRVKPQKSES